MGKPSLRNRWPTVHRFVAAMLGTAQISTSLSIPTDRHPPPATDFSRPLRTVVQFASRSTHPAGRPNGAPAPRSLTS